MKIFHSLSLTLIAIALLSGCNSTTHNPSLAAAHDNYNNASRDPDVTNLAALELRNASDSLNKADQALKHGDDASKVDHLAYLANQKVLIAQETGKRKAAEEAVANASISRNQVRLDARTAEANAAKRQVAVMQMNADQHAGEMAAANANAESDQALIAKQQRQLRELNAKQTERGLVITLGDVLFNTNKAQLKSGGMHNVQKLADFLKEYPDHKVLIEGYTDSRGSESYNQKLSERRAENVRTALVVVMGIDSSRVITRGYGEKFPVASNSNATDRQMNRRVEIILSDAKGKIASR